MDKLDLKCTHNHADYGLENFPTVIISDVTLSCFQIMEIKHI